MFPGQSVPGILPPETDWKEDLDLYKRHFKIYVPGVGKAFPNIGDQATWMRSWADSSLGAGMSAYGQGRILWAIAQIVNHIHKYYWHGIGSSVLITDKEIELYNNHVSLTKNGLVSDIEKELNDQMANYAWENKMFSTTAVAAYYPMPPGARAANIRNGSWDDFHDEKLSIVFKEWLSRLSSSVGNAPRNKSIEPLNKLHFFSFGFSRGAAEARVFLNWFIRFCQVDALLNKGIGGNLSLAGIPIVHEFMGVFDTVASVGVADIFSSTTGHDWWGDAVALQVPPEVGKCIHFVSAHEQRRCFPLDSVYQGQKLPSYCEEIVFPGVHSDIGGGYAPLDQGKGFFRDGTSLLSRIPLIEMYRRARLAGVPLVLEKASYKTLNAYKINRKLIDDFNKYLSFFDKKEGTTAEIITPHWLKQIKFRINVLRGNKNLDSKSRAENMDMDLRNSISKKEKDLKIEGDKKEIHRFNMSDDKVYADRLNLANETQKKSASMLETEYYRFKYFLDKNNLLMDSGGNLSPLTNSKDSIRAPGSYEVKFLSDNIGNVIISKEEEYFIDNYIHDSIAGFCLDGIDEYSLSLHETFVYFGYRCIFSGSEVMYQVPYGNGFDYSREEKALQNDKKERERKQKERELQIMQDQMASQFSWDGLAHLR